MKLFSMPTELSVLRTICRGGKVGEWLLGNVEDTLFHTDVGQTTFQRIQKLLTTTNAMPRWSALVQDPVIPTEIRDRLRKDSDRSLSKKDAKDAINLLRVYAAMRRYAGVAARITTDLEQDAVDVESLSDYIADAVGQVRLGSYHAHMYRFGAGDIVDTNRVIEELLTGEGERGIPTCFHTWDSVNGTIPNSAVWLIASSTGGGKCLRKGQKVVMYDGRLEAVENIKVGDRLMGADSKPRNVLRTANGHGEIYAIRPERGRTWYCTRDHVLVLEKTSGMQAEVPLWQYMTLWDSAAKNSYYAVFNAQGIDFTPQEQPLPLNPYLLAILLCSDLDGDPKILLRDSVDKPLHKFLKKICRKKDLSLETRELPSETEYVERILSSRSPDVQNEIVTILKTMGLHGISRDERFIPHEYLVASRDCRLRLLAGLIDMGGYKFWQHKFAFTSDNPTMVENIRFLAESLGIPTTTTVGSSKNMHKRTWQTVIFHGANQAHIPVRLKRNKIKGFVADEPTGTHCTFSVSHVGEDDWYGFELDGDNRYLLEDFSVTHNSLMTATLCRNMAQNGMRPCIIPLEMSVSEMAARLLASVAQVPVHKVLQGRSKLTNNETRKIIKRYAKWIKRCRKVGGSYLLYEPAVSLTMQAALHATKAYAPTCIIIDQVTLLGDVDGENDWRKMSEAVRDAKRFARQNNIPVIVVAQLAAGSQELRYSKRMMDDADVAWVWTADDHAKQSGIITIRQPKARNRNPMTFQLFVDWETMDMRDVTDADLQRAQMISDTVTLEDKSRNQGRGV